MNEKGTKIMQRHYRTVLVLAFALGILLGHNTRFVHAVLTLNLKDLNSNCTPGYNLLGVYVQCEVQLEDGGSLDSSPVTGSIIYNGGVGSFLINVTTGISKPLIGNPYSAELDLNSVNLNGPAGSLLIKVSDTDFTLLPPPVGSATTSVGGTTQGTVKVETFLDPFNMVFGETIPLSLDPKTSQPFQYSAGAPAFSANISTLVPLPTPTIFSLTQKVTITHSGSWGTTSFDSFVAVATPEPGTLLLLGTGLLGFAGYTWRRRKIQKV
jgi:hypothetical protein